MNAQAVQDWLRIRRQLLDMEAGFTDLAIRVAEGKEIEQVLQQQRELLEAQRALCTAAYQRAFPASDQIAGSSAADRPLAEPRPGPGSTLGK